MGEGQAASRHQMVERVAAAVSAIGALVLILSNAIEISGNFAIS